MRIIKNMLIPFLAFVLSTNLSAQDKTIDLKDVFTKREMHPVRMSNLQWKGSTDDFTYIEGKNYMIGNAAIKDSETAFLSLEELNSEFKKNNLDTLRRLPGISWKDDNVFTFRSKGKLYAFNTTDHIMSVLGNYNSKAENTEFAAKTYYSAYTKDNDLYVNIDGNEYTVAEEEDENIVYGQTVHRNEFGISDGIYWSPNGNLLAFYRKDESKVSDYPLVNMTARVGELKNSKYPMAGMSSEFVTVGVYNPKEKSVVYLKTGDPKEQYLTNVTWSPDETKIYIAVLNRGQDHVKLNVYDATSGNFIKTLFEEKHPKYVEPEHGPIFISNEEFLWYSERDGFNHLYRYNSEGKLINQVTNGNWLVKDFFGFDEKKKNIFFTATIDSPLENHAYSANIKKGSIKKVTQIAGTHRVQLSDDKKYVIDQYSNYETANEYLITDIKGNTIQILKENYNPLKDYNLGELSVFTIKSEDDQDLYCRLIKPADFDASKKYPVIIYTYGGPHAQLVTNSWLAGSGYFLNYLAQQGYVVFTVDNHGSANRGFEFENAVHRKMGTIEVRDQMKGVEYLKSLDFVDADRIGIHGWSYGGFMTISSILKNPGVFKAGVAGGPVIDWKYYEIMYGERYMDTPEENPEGYKEASLLNYVENMEDERLLIIHGGLDATVVMQHSMDFLRQTVKEGKQVDFFVYPTHEHNVRGMDRYHLWMKIADYFGRHL